MQKKFLNPLKNTENKTEKKIQKIKRNIIKVIKKKLQNIRKKYAKEHQQEVKRYKQKYAENNTEKIKESKKRQRKERRKNDPCFNAILQLRYLVYSSLVLRNNYKKTSHTYEILGCSYEEAWGHLKQTWLENYGKEWDGEPYHIDHIIPLATAKTKEDVVKLCNINNLQLLTPQDNLSKQDKLVWQTEYKKNSMVEGQLSTIFIYYTIKQKQIKIKQKRIDKYGCKD